MNPNNVKLVKLAAEATQHIPHGGGEEAAAIMTCLINLEIAEKLNETLNRIADRRNDHYGYSSGGYKLSR